MAGVRHQPDVLAAQPGETIRAIQQLDLLVVVDVIPSEIAGWADVVLPESIYLERYDELHSEAFRHPFIALRQPVVEAPGDQKPNWWIAKTLAEKLGLGAYYPWNDIEEYLAARLKAGGYSFDELKRDGDHSGQAAADLSSKMARPRCSTRLRRRSSSIPRN